MRIEVLDEICEHDAAKASLVVGLAGEFEDVGANGLEPMFATGRDGPQ